MLDVIEEIMKKKYEWCRVTPDNPKYVYLGWDTYSYLKDQTSKFAVHSMEGCTEGSGEVCGLQILIVNTPTHIGVGN